MREDLDIWIGDDIGPTISNLVALVPSSSEGEDKIYEELDEGSN